MGLAPSAAWSPPPSTPLRPRIPPPAPGPPPPGALQKEPRGVGGRGTERAGREGVWLDGRVSPITMKDGGDPPNTSWGQTHIWGLLSNLCLSGVPKCGHSRRSRSQKRANERKRAQRQVCKKNTKVFLVNGWGQTVPYVPRNTGKPNFWAGHPRILPGYPGSARKV